MNNDRASNLFAFLRRNLVNGSAQADRILAWDIIIRWTATCNTNRSRREFRGFLEKIEKILPGDRLVATRSALSLANAPDSTRRELDDAKLLACTSRFRHAIKRTAAQSFKKFNCTANCTASIPALAAPPGQQSRKYRLENLATKAVSRLRNRQGPSGFSWTC